MDRVQGTPNEVLCIRGNVSASVHGTNVKNLGVGTRGNAVSMSCTGVPRSQGATPPEGPP